MAKQIKNKCVQELSTFILDKLKNKCERIDKSKQATLTKKPGAWMRCDGWVQECPLLSQEGSQAI